MNKKKHASEGFSLVELLIAMAIGVFIIGAVSQVFISTKRSNNLLLAETELQENARFAFSVITNIVQKAGNLGCKTPTATNTNSLLNFNDGTFRPWVAIEGWEAKDSAYGDKYTAENTISTLVTPDNHWTGTVDTVLDNGIESVKNSDILKVWHTADRSGALTAISTDEMTFSAIDIERGDIVVVNDCKTVTFLQACNCDLGDSPACSSTDERVEFSPSACGTPGNNPFDPTGINLETADVQALKLSVFFIGKRNTGNFTSLFVHKLGKDGMLGEREEILEGLESMQIQYGEDINNDKSPNYYVSADQVQDWRNVVSIRLSLLMRSFKNGLLSKPQNLNFNGHKVAIAEDDSHLRRVYTSTISLRNRNIGY